MATHVEEPKLTKHDATILDLAFAMDCTGSMSSYIRTAQENIRTIVEQIVAAEKSDIHLALVEYRDHPPQDRTFVTRTHDFTASVKQMKEWLDSCSAQGGGDTPEAVADALHDVLKLNWRTEATKICVLISDAPPHGLSAKIGDKFPNGCPNNLDPMKTVRDMAQKGITLYTVGCEPSITPYKEFFTAIAYITGGQYVPLAGAKSLTQIIIGGAQEEISLEKWMEDVNKEVLSEMEARGTADIDEAEVGIRVQSILKSKGAKSKQLQRNNIALSAPNAFAKKVCGFSKMSEVNSIYDDECTLSPPSPARRGMSMSMDLCSVMYDEFKIPDRPRDCEMRPMPSAIETEIYSVEEDEVKMEQAMRMVQKSKMRNMSKFS